MKTSEVAFFKDVEIKPIFLILHHTASNADMSDYLANPGDGRKVSVHFHVSRKGAVTRYSNLADLSAKTAKQAFHAGESEWTYRGKKYTSLNRYSIGIEMDGDGKTPFTKIQLDKTFKLSLQIMSAFGIAPECVLGHKEISPGRKIDPSPMDMDEVRGTLAMRIASGIGASGVADMETAAELLAIIWHGGKGVLARIPEKARRGHPLIKIANEATAYIKNKYGIK